MHEAHGFTLIELSIVLVIIGLIIGGILVGQDLIKAAEVRAQISQIEKYNSAVNTFRGKFQAIPGDMAVATANQFGIPVGFSCNGAQGQRDGNGLIDGFWAPNLLIQGAGETHMFWQDLSSTAAGNLIDGSFPNSGAVSNGCGAIAATLTTTLGTTYIGDFYPVGKIGHGTFVYVYDSGGYNWYGLSTVLTIPTGSGALTSNAVIPVTQAYNIDKKVDDGLPTTGSVQATYLNNNSVTVQTVNAQATDSTTTCYNTTSNAYSISSLADYGSHGNCALSFRFQ
jgi:prepilin-type N-terminal cleavage/methylation domain-containing protein